MLSLQAVRIPPGTLLGFKVVPGSRISPASFAGQTEADWSAIYGQLTVRRAICYLPGQWDRGHRQASLVALRSSGIEDMQAILIEDCRLADGRLEASLKAEMVRDHLRQAGLDPSGAPPLMQAVGRWEPATILVLPDDGDHQEMVIPHGLFEGEAPAIIAEPLFQFSANIPWKLDACVDVKTGQAVALPREATEDTRILAEALHSKSNPNHSQWLP